MKMKILALIKKEIRDDKNVFIFGPLFLIAYFAYLYSRIGNWEKGLPLFLGTSLSISALLIFSLIKGILVLRDEWDKDTIYLLFSLPVGKFNILLAKWVVEIVEILLFTVIIVSFSYSVMLKDLGNSFGISIPELAELAGILFILSISLSVIPYFSYTLSRCVRRYRRLLIGLSYFGFFIFYWKTADIFSDLFKFLPDPVITILDPISKTMERNVIEISGIYYLFALSITLFLLSLLLFEKEVEV
jgi:ABC-type transport system involved in multi-copper enzyme maturation permease subunit